MELHFWLQQPSGGLPLNFGIMKRTGYPVVFDVTHSLQIPGGRSDSADGRRQSVFELMLAGMSQGIGGLFLESHGPYSGKV